MPGDRRTCENCGSDFTVPERWMANRFCSMSCANGRQRRRRSISERFWPKVDKNGPVPAHRPDLGPCWVWTASRTPAGYGQIANNDRVLVTAHRWAWEQENGPVPDGLELDHLCRNRACVRTSHLEAVTGAVNAQRGLKGDLKPSAPLREVCANGHLMTPENRFSRKDGTGRKVGCRQCSRDSSRRYYDRTRRAA
jgi:hypothetical protein